MTDTIVYKFGGASVKDSQALQNLANLLRARHRPNLLIVVSAMGKTTNLLESILASKMENANLEAQLDALKTYHVEICEAVFPKGHQVFEALESLVDSLRNKLSLPISRENYDEYYDRIVGFGELISSRILADFLCLEQLPVIWQDARALIETTSEFRFARIDFEKTRANCQDHLKPVLQNSCVLTQGFIGADPLGRPTTLGREGSDFTAAILATSLDAESVTIWKDVPGVLNADPKLFPDTRLFSELAYRQAAEMTYYGASVIHPKTIKPLANAGIPLFVKSFLNPEAAGTKIHGAAESNRIPSIVLKQNQILISLKVTDFTFVEEKHLHFAYEHLQLLKLRVNMLQTSAISISLVIDSQLFKLEQLVEKMKEKFEVRYNEGLELLTILNPDPDSIIQVTGGMEILLEQTTRTTFQIVRKGK
jgi:aspartate kinase